MSSKASLALLRAAENDYVLISGQIFNQLVIDVIALNVRYRYLPADTEHVSGKVFLFSSHLTLLILPSAAECAFGPPLGCPRIIRRKSAQRGHCRSNSVGKRAGGIAL